MNFESIKAVGLGGLIAVIVLILCVIFAFMGQTLSANQVLLLIGLLALARLT